MDRATPDFHRSHNPTCCEAVRKGCKSQLVTAFEFEHDQGEFRVKRTILISEQPSVMLQLLRAAGPPFGLKICRSGDGTSARASKWSICQIRAPGAHRGQYRVNSPPASVVRAVGSSNSPRTARVDHQLCPALCRAHWRALCDTKLEHTTATCNPRAAARLVSPSLYPITGLSSINYRIAILGRRVQNGGTREVHETTVCCTARVP